MLYGSGHVKYTVHNSGAYCCGFLPGEVNYSGGTMTLRKSLQNFGRRKVSLWTLDSAIRNSTIWKMVYGIVQYGKWYMSIYNVHVYMYIVCSIKQVHLLYMYTICM